MKAQQENAEAGDPTRIHKLAVLCVCVCEEESKDEQKKLPFNTLLHAFSRFFFFFSQSICNLKCTAACADECLRIMRLTLTLNTTV